MSLKYQCVMSWNDRWRKIFRYMRHGRRHRIGNPPSLWSTGERFYHEYGEQLVQ